MSEISISRSLWWFNSHKCKPKYNSDASQPGWLKKAEKSVLTTTIERTNWYRVLLLCYCYLIGIDVAIISRISTAQGKIRIILKTYDIFRQSPSTNRDYKINQVLIVILKVKQRSLAFSSFFSNSSCNFSVINLE